MLNQTRARKAWLSGVGLLRQAGDDPDASAAYRQQAAQQFTQAVHLDPEMTDAWLGVHGTTDQKAQAIVEMARNAQRFGEETRRNDVRLWSRFDIGTYVDFTLETYQDMWCVVTAHHLAQAEYDLAESAIAYVPVETLTGRFLHGRFALLQGRPDDALQNVRQVMGKDKYLEIEARLIAAQALAEMGATSGAREILRDVLGQQLLPGIYSEAHKVMGLIAQAEGDEDAAVTSFQLAYAENPYLPDLRELMESAGTTPVNISGTASAGAPQNRARDESEESVSDILAELDSQIGQAGIKQQVRALLAQTRAQLARNDAGLEQARLTEHFVFVGPPGTGKTTIARVIARLYKALGILESNQVVEVDRSGLVAEYLGQTNARTKRVIDRALGGVLFIDEAYTLQTEGYTGGDPYGQEAIDTILKRMEDDRERLIVIAAGYPEPMRRFLGSNPGLKSRFTTTIGFDPYTADELTQIADVMATASGNVVTAEARVAVKQVLDDLEAAGTLQESTFGNARYVRTLLEKAARQRDQRLFADENAPTPDRETLTQLVAADVRRAAGELD